MNNQAATPQTGQRAVTPTPDPQNPWGVWGEPAVLVPYGPSGVGKSTDALYSFPTALFLRQPGALKPSVRVVGYKPLWQKDITTLMDAIKLLRAVGKLPAAQKPFVVVIDDLSLIAANTLRALKDGGESGYSLWGTLGDLISELCEVARRVAGVHVVMNGHDQAPFTDEEGAYWRGGPRLPSKKQTAQIPYIADGVYRCVNSDDRDGVPWRGVYRCVLDDAWMMKDRHGHYGDLPMNMAEILRNAGYWLPRAPGLEWQETWAELIAQSITATPERRSAVKTGAIDKMKQNGFHPLHIRWAVRDGLDRAALRLADQKILDF